MKVFVLDINNNPLIPCTPSKARKLIKDGKAEKVWSRLKVFGIKLLYEVSSEYNKNQNISLGYDCGTKYEGMSIVIGSQNVQNIKINLPDKTPIKKKMEFRKRCRKSRRYRNTRFRKAKHLNRVRKGYIAPSQRVIVSSRLKFLSELYKMYPINIAGIEDINFNSSRKRSLGKFFSTMEIGKSEIREFFRLKGTSLKEYKGYETKSLREFYGYKKSAVKSSDTFESHNCDSLSLALACVNAAEPVIPNETLLIVDDTYRFYRRQLHKYFSGKAGIRKKFSRGNVNGIKKGRIIGYKGSKYILTGDNKGQVRLASFDRVKRPYINPLKISFICNEFIVKEVKYNA